MADTNGFNATNVESNADIDPIPAGEYVAAITASDLKPTKNGKGGYLQIEMEVLEGAYKGHKLWDRLTLSHANTPMMGIDRSVLSSICRAVNVLRLRDSIDLHNLPLVVSVAVRNREDTGEPMNVINGYAKRATGVATITAGGEG